VKNMALTPEETTQYRAWLVDAQQAMHNITTGQQAKVYVDQNGERVEYQMSNVNTLRSYITELKSALGILTKPIGPMRFWM
jgi:hypothetical protein